MYHYYIVDKTKKKKSSKDSKEERKDSKEDKRDKDKSKSDNRKKSDGKNKSDECKSGSSSNPVDLNLPGSRFTVEALFLLSTSFFSTSLSNLM
jgi:hypothetical protein